MIAFYKYNYLRSILAATLLVGAGLIGCDPSDYDYAGKDNSDNKILRYDVNAPFGALNPLSTKFSGSTHVFPLMYSYLFVPDAQGDLQGDLAVAWSYDRQRRCWTVDLRRDALFHNQQPVTVEDVIYSIAKWISGHYPAIAETINRVEGLSSHRLRIHLHKEDPDLPRKIWSFEIIPSPKKQPPPTMEGTVGSGPFKFSHRHGRDMVALEAFEAYYGGRPALDRVVFHYQPDREKAWTRLLAGKTDIAEGISPRNYTIIKQYDNRFHFDEYVMPFYSILLYNSYDPLFSNQEVRKALTMGIDRDHIIDTILKGYGRKVAGPMGAHSPFRHPELPHLPYDPEQALSLLRQSGWLPDNKGRLHKNGRRFEFEILVFREGQIEKEVARFIQLSLNDIGIRVHLKALGFEALKRRYFQNSQFQAVLIELNSGHRRYEPVVANWSQGRHGGSEAGGFDHPAVNRLLRSASAEKDPAIHRRLMQEVDALIADLQPGTFLFQKTAFDAMSKRFYLPHRFSLSHEGIYRLKNTAPN